MPTIEIDKALLPWVAMLDTNVVFRALGEIEDDRSPSCKAFWEAMLAERRNMLMCAPSLAELLRKRAVPIPRVRGFAVVGFDERAAMVLASQLPMEVLKEVSERFCFVLEALTGALVVGEACGWGGGRGWVPGESRATWKELLARVGVPQ